MENEREEREATEPYKIMFADGHMAVWQCHNHNHALDRAKVTYPDKIVRNVSKVK